MTCKQCRGTGWVESLDPLSPYGRMMCSDPDCDVDHWEVYEQNGHGWSEPTLTHDERYQNGEERRP